MAIPIITTTAGALAFLESAVNWQGTFFPQDWQASLWTNNYMADDSSDVPNFTFFTYPGVGFIIPTWAPVALVAGVPSRVGSTITWTQTSGFPGTFYGVCVVDGNGTHMVGAGNFTAPVVLTNAQPSYSAQITITGISEF